MNAHTACATAARHTCTLLVVHWQARTEVFADCSIIACSIGQGDAGDGRGSRVERPCCGGQTEEQAEQERVHRYQQVGVKVARCDFHLELYKNRVHKTRLWVCVGMARGRRTRGGRVDFTRRLQCLPHCG